MSLWVLISVILAPSSVFALEIQGRLNGSIIPSGLRSITAEERIPILALIYGVDEDLAWAIIHCESSWRPRALNLNKNLTVDHSYWQVNTVWIEKMSIIGFDVTNPDQNLEAGFWILSKYGVGPWSASKKCWQRKTLSRQGTG